MCWIFVPNLWSKEMVCKEDVLLWFKDLESYKRIDVIYELFKMCIPFEMRFLGSCLEEMGKHTYQELRGPTIAANDLEKLSKDAFFNAGILDENVRHRVLISLSLLSSRNSGVANWLYKTLLRTDWIEDYIVKGNIKDENVQCEFLCLYVMASLHPAFCFEQKLFFSKIISSLLDLKENKNRLSPNTTPYGYPPGFGYPTLKSMSSDTPTIPVKISSSMPCIDDVIIQQQPPGIPHGPPMQNPQEYIAWSRPGFPCGVPDTVPPPFPVANLSPLVSQSSSPIQSRSSSPHRTLVSLRTVASLQQPQLTPATPIGDVLPVTNLPQAGGDPLLANNFPSFSYINENQIKLTNQQEEEFNSIPEDKILSDMQWMPKDIKQANGLRFQACNKSSRPYLIDQMQALNLDGDCLQQQHSNSSSNSSLNQTPPETPTTTTTTTTTTRTGDKNRCNGMPFVATQMCEHTSPPPPQPPPPNYNNCSVPYTTYPTFAAIPTRFPYNTQSYRPPFTAHYPSTYQTNDNNTYPTYTFPYMSIIYSSPQQFSSSRNPNCYNCGGIGHLGQDCTIQNIEDITQKKTYTLEFTTPLPDADK